MSNPCDRAATFRGLIIEYTLLRGTKTKSLGVSITVNLEECRDDETNEWVAWAQYQMVANGSVNVIKGNGELNQRGIESLIKHAGWDGNFESIANGSWQPTRCQVSTEQEEEKYGGGFKINWVNGYDDAAKSGGNVTPDELKQLQAQYGPQVRALAASAKLNAPKPTGKPPAPPKAGPKAVAKQAPAADPEREPGGDDSGIPF